jgi:hypothetical protein
VPGELFVDLRVPGDGLLVSSERIEIHIVPATVAEEYAAGLGELPDELGALHTAISFVR